MMRVIDMLRKVIVTFTLLILITFFVFATSVLFDAGHAQSAGNADWNVNGAYSDFAQALRNFFGVDQTYHWLTPTLLEKYSVLIIPEPNDPFSPEEQQAILQFIHNGGGVFFIADHEGADRNHNGWDAVSIFDEFVGTLGFHFNHDTMSEYPIKYIKPSPITLGVKRIGEWGGCTLSLSKNVHPAVKLYTGQVYVAYGEYGKGRFVAIGDSSPFDDGTGTFGKELYDGWHTGDDSVIAVNSVYWLATGKATDTAIYVIPPKISKISIPSSKKVVVYFNKTIRAFIVPGVNVAIPGMKIERTSVNGNILTIILLQPLKKGKYTLITRDILDLYGNSSPMNSIHFEYRGK